MKRGMMIERKRRACTVIQCALYMIKQQKNDKKNKCRRDRGRRKSAS